MCELSQQRQSCPFTSRFTALPRSEAFDHKTPVEVNGYLMRCPTLRHKTIIPDAGRSVRNNACGCLPATSWAIMDVW